MTKQRANITTIAEVLVDEIEEMKAAAAKMEKVPQQLEDKINHVAKTQLNVNVEPLNKHLELMDNKTNAFNSSIKEQNQIAAKNTESQEAILSRFKELKEKKVPLPNWAFVMLLVMGLLLTGASIGTYHYYQKSDKWENTANEYKKEAAHWYYEANPEEKPKQD